MTILSDPNVAFLLFVVGLAGLLVETVHPSILGGVIGAICLLLAFVGFSGLPVNIAGLLLIGFGMVLFVLESQLTSHGVLAAGGLIVFVIGASVLYSQPPGPASGPTIAVATPLIVMTAALFAAFMGAVIYAAVRVRRMTAPRGAVGTSVPLGTVGVVQAPLSPQGTVHLGGETWSARSADGGRLDRDTPVRLVGFDGLVAVVSRDTTSPATART
jgi:membrane-bound serine protease (ClpP class)